MESGSPESGARIGHWVVDRWVGSGAWADVYRVRRADLPDLAGALKWVRDPADARRLAREAEVLERLDHDGIVRVLDHGPGSRWIVLTWAPGRPLDAVGRVASEEAAYLAAGIVDALAHAHARGVAHGDVKPANLRVDPLGRTMLLDFGSATVVGPDPTRVMGATPRYAPPEWFDTVGADPRAADLYAVGVVLCELVTGERAFRSRGLDELARVKRAGPLREASLSGDIASIVQATTAVDPAARPTAAALHRRLEPLARPVSEALFSRTHAPASAVTVEEASGPRYTLVDELGRGGMGVVYRAWDVRLGRYVALKRPPPWGVDERRFLREVRLHGGLSHPGIVRVLDADRDQDGLYFTMELVDGTDLASRLEAGPVPPQEGARWMGQVAEALAYAHAQGLVHRDVKPANILLDRAGRARLSDFGLARPAEGDGAALTREGQVGTPAYMAPEQATGAAPDPCSDVHALGVVLHEVVTGRLPGPADPARSSTPGVPRALLDIAAWAMHPEPGRRPSASELAADLARFQQGLPVHARPVGVLGRMGIALRRHRREAGLAAGVLLLLGGGLVGTNAWSAWSRRTAEDARIEAAEGRWQTLRAHLGSTEGDEAARTASFDAFVTDPETAGTPARVGAWLWRAEDLARDERIEASLDATAQAWIEARDEDLPRVVRALSERLFAAGRLDAAMGLSGAAERLGVRGGLDDLRQKELLAARDFEAAAALSGRLTALATALAPATRGPASPEGMDLVDGGAGRPLVGTDRSRRVMLSRDPSLSELRAWSGGGAWPRRVFPLGPDHVWTDTPEAGVYRIVDETLVMERAMPLAPWAVLPDPTHPGAYLVTQNAPARLVRWRPGAHTFEDLWEPLGALGGEPEGLAVGDLDGDGAAEVVLNPGHWGAFEVWVLTGLEGEELAPVTFEKFGYTPGIGIARTASGPMLATATATDFGSRRAFPTGSPYGQARGVHLHALRDGRLQERDHAPAPEDCRLVGVGDVDGDGLDEVVARCGFEHTLIVSPTAEGFEHVWLQGLEPRAVADLDGDGDAELVVRDGEAGVLWTLGSGAERIPVVTPPSAPSWTRFDHPGARRATALAEVGLYEAAARRLVAISRSEAEPRMPMEAARMLREAGRVREALDTLRGVEAPEVQAALAGMLRDEGHLAEAVQLEGGAAAIPWWSSDFAEGLPEAVQVHTPWATRLDPVANVLDVWSARVGARGAPVWSVPLEPSDRVIARVDLTVDRLDWSGGLDVVLGEDLGGTPAIGLRVEGWGGARLTHARVSCLAGDPLVVRTRPFEEGPLEVGVELSWDGEAWGCVVDVDGVREAHRVPGPPPRAPLILGLREAALVGPSVAAAHARITRLEVEGTLPRAGGPVSEAWRALAEGRPEEALERLPEDDPVRLLALSEAGRTAEASAVASRLAAEPPPWLSASLGTGRYAWEPALQQALGPRWLGRWSEVHGIRVFSSRPSPETDEILVRGLPDLSSWTLDPDQREDQVVLLLERARALRRASAHGRARQDLRRALDIVEDTPVLARFALPLWKELAGVEHAVGRERAARGARDAATALAPVGMRIERELSFIGGDGG